MEPDDDLTSDLVMQKKQVLLDQAALHLDYAQLELVKLAFTVANHAHLNQKRKSGEPYITHPTEVATLVASWGLDEETIASALLHDVIEDTYVSKEDIIRIFGHNVADLVDGVTKLKQLNFESEESTHAESFRKIVLAMAKDVRVIIIKLADRLHNMLTLSAMSVAKRKEIALETMEVYVPIANKIGLHKIHLQLADESFKHLHPMRYRAIENAMLESQKQQLPAIEEIASTISRILKANGISARFIYKQHSLYNLYRRMKMAGQPFSGIHDIFEIKILVKKISDCYLTLGVLHNTYKPIPGRFKDYIAIPKSNNYQSLHSILIGPMGIPLQLHIRTDVMDEVAEFGVLRQRLKYKADEEFISASHKTTDWINDILDIQASTFSADEFFVNLKQDLLPGDIYAFTPKGKAILLPKGATALDFAYFVHSDIGNHCSQVRINQRLAKLNTVLRNGDIVEVITNKEVEPREEWLSVVTSGKATSKIKQYFKEQRFESSVENGSQLLNLGLSLFKPNLVIDDNMLNNVITSYYPKLTIDDFKQQVGVGHISALEVVKKILDHDHNVPMQLVLSNCKLPIIQDMRCFALPGEKILAQINGSGELILHHPTCKTVKMKGLDNFTFVHITNDVKRDFFVKIHVTIDDKPGTLAQLSTVIADKQMSMAALVQSFSTEEITNVTITLRVKSLMEVQELVSELNNKTFIHKAVIN